MGGFDRISPYENISMGSNVSFERPYFRARQHVHDICTLSLRRPGLIGNFEPRDGLSLAIDAIVATWPPQLVRDMFGISNDD
jgi:hypothetical protein